MGERKKIQAIMTKVEKQNQRDVPRQTTESSRPSRRSRKYARWRKQKNALRYSLTSIGTRDNTNQSSHCKTNNRNTGDRTRGKGKGKEDHQHPQPTRSGEPPKLLKIPGNNKRQKTKKNNNNYHLTTAIQRATVSWVGGFQPHHCGHDLFIIGSSLLAASICLHLSQWTPAGTATTTKTTTTTPVRSTKG